MQNFFAAYAPQKTARRTAPPPFTTPMIPSWKRAKMRGTAMHIVGFRMARSSRTFCTVLLRKPMRPPQNMIPPVAARSITCAYGRNARWHGRSTLPTNECPLAIASTKHRCEMMTPFGVPVVPDEYE